MPQQNLYFIAIIPPAYICKEVTAFRNDFKENYNSKAALKNMPHITLKAPFKIDAAHHEDVLKWFALLPVTKKHFSIQLHNFGAFKNPNNPVVFVQPVITEPLRILQEQIITSFATAYTNIPLHYHEHKFAPHMTIAYRDLAFSEFNKAWEVYCDKKYDALFEVKSFYLLQHNGVEWFVTAEHRID